ncbi:MAG: tyrosine-type recombinase/integrase [Actinomycetota bacterium]|nr:tyrosine-type recombinase/integrase [Actinomycetota bacterium]
MAEIAVEVRGVIHTGPPKTRAGRRTVTLPRSITEAMAEHLTRLQSDIDLVFPAPGGGHLRTPSWRRRYWAPAIEAAGLVPLRPHDLRHTAVALWIAAGAGPKEVACRAGHTSVAFALDRYGHLFEGHDEPLRDRLDAMAASASLRPGRAAVIRFVRDASGLPRPVRGLGTHRWNLEGSNDPSDLPVLSWA